MTIEPALCKATADPGIGAPEAVAGIRLAPQIPPCEYARLFFEESREALLLTQPDGQIFAVNPAACRLFGYDEASLCRLGRAGIVDVNDPALHAILATRTKEGFAEGELRFFRADGSVFVGEMRSSAFLDMDGKERSTVVIHDITQKIAQQTALRESEAFKSGVFDAMSENVAVLDAAGVILATNKAWRRFASQNGIPGDACDFIGTPYFETCRCAHGASDGQEAEVALAGIRAVLDKTLPEFELEYPCHSPTQQRWFRMHVVPLGGASTHVVVAHQDISARKAAELAIQRKEHALRALIDNIPFMVWLKNCDDRLLTANTHFARAAGHTSPESLEGKTTAEIWPQPKATAFRDCDESVIASGTQSTVVEERSCNNETRWVETYRAPVKDDKGELIGVVGFARDVSEQQRTEADLRVAAAAFEAQEGMAITDASGKILRVNQAFCETTGYSAEEAVGQNPRILQSGVHDAAYYAEMWARIARDGVWKGEIWNRRKSGEVYPEWLTILAVKNAQGQVTHYVGTKNDISERKAAEDRILQLAFYDALTGLPNRRLVLDRLQQALASSGRSLLEGALILIDLDNFKTFNDVQGHRKGDALLVQVAQRLRESVREADTVARIGGDEFVVILENLHQNAMDAAALARAVAEKIQTALNAAYMVDAREHHSTPSIGITLFSDHDETADELLTRADLAMYRAKAAGRNTLRFFDPEMQTVVMARAAMEADLHDAVRAQQFVLHYQAQVDSKGRFTGAETLVRWMHPKRGMVPPMDFIPLAEESGLILPLGLWVLETACIQLALWAPRADTAALTLAVNVSSRQFRHDDFVEQVLEVIRRTGIDPSRLKLELTESMLLDDVEAIIVKMNALKAHGVGFSLDDFGTGFSSLSYLKRLPLDQLKIDRSFVRDVLIDPNDAAIARTIVALAHSLGLSVIAEGVETEEQRGFLADNGCHACQGYLFGRPVALPEFELQLGRQ